MPSERDAERDVLVGFFFVNLTADYYEGQTRSKSEIPRAMAP